MGRTPARCAARRTSRRDHRWHGRRAANDPNSSHRRRSPAIPGRAAVTGPRRLLAIDTALTRAVLALGGRDGTLIDEEAWGAGHRHGEELLTRLQGLLERNAIALPDLAGVACGTGPGAFTGLRVGIATAKALAHGLRVPIVGLSTAAALVAAATLPGQPVPIGVLLPAGPSDRVLVLDGEARLLPKGTEPPADLAPDRLVAVDLEGRADPAALVRGDRAVEGLGAALLRLGAARLAEGDGDDLARLVPEYGT